jgi:hypothetical protein
VLLDTDEVGVVPAQRRGASKPWRGSAVLQLQVARRAGSPTARVSDSRAECRASVFEPHIGSHFCRSETPKSARASAEADQAAAPRWHIQKPGDALSVAPIQELSRGGGIMNRSSFFDT